MISIPTSLRVILIGSSLFVLVYVIYNSIKTKMNIRYAILWILWAIVVFVLGLFPAWALKVAQTMGFVTVYNFIFVVMIAILFGFSYYSYVKMSKMDEELKKLNYAIAVLNKERSKENKSGYSSHL